MKNLILCLSIVLFLPLAFSSNFSSNLLLPSEVSSASYPSVLDTDGNPLKVGLKYFVLPILRGTGGGLILSRVVDKNVKNCPQDIVQDPNELHRGRPVEFIPAYPNKTGQLILKNNPINVKFYSPSATSRCANFTVWKMDKKYKYVVGRGKVGILNNIRNWFRIRPYGKGYRFVYCPTLCVPCKIKCFDLVISYEKQGDNADIRRLAASGNELPFSVQFKKA
ncbi:PREDICTED: kunitz trypsin inhibitor 2-like [Nicotiana attenuata]|uniref:21 kDa seed protein n=1 Tax=Nicotiana attenuata TaxID=49451 RepID=A0A314KVR9_NICAT|nr:PREDICTED: kunitz trypsin inhibitor 2-like [Nicotiana attenuata]OIT32734.1 21 kda seed protein [Nicotiana attenuata]